MALYISHDNQNLLWNVLHKNPQFANFDPQHKSELFRTNIEQIYTSISKTNISVQELQEYNRQTIRNIVKPQNQRAEGPPYATPFVAYDAAPNTAPVSVFSRNSAPQTKEEPFAKYQDNYNSMFVRKDPKPIEFAEKEDTKIENMHELLEKHKREREQEMQMHVETMKNTIILPTTQNTKDTTTELQDEIKELKNVIQSIRDEIDALRTQMSQSSVIIPVPAPSTDEPEHITIQITDT